MVCRKGLFVYGENEVMVASHWLEENVGREYFGDMMWECRRQIVHESTKGVRE